MCVWVAAQLTHIRATLGDTPFEENFEKTLILAFGASCMTSLNCTGFFRILAYYATSVSNFINEIPTDILKGS